MRKIFLMLFFTVPFASVSMGQVKIGDNPGSISPGSVLELESTSKALTLPRMTTVQMEAIPSPIKGMIVFNIDSNCIYLFKANNVWTSIIPALPEYNPWPYNSDPQSQGSGIIGNAKGIIALTGSGLVASGDYSHAEGLNAVASGKYAWSFGNADTASANGSVAMGTENKASGINSLAMGYKNIAANQSAVSLGQENKDSGWASMAIGLKNSIGSQANYSHTLGYNNRVAAGWSGVILGESNTIRNGRANIALGANNIADGNFNILGGKENETVTGNTNFLAGEKNIVLSGNSNIVLGFNNTASGNYNHLSGNYNSTIAGNSNILNGQNNIINSGSSNALFGFNNTASANYAAAIGNGNTVQNESAIAFGNNNKDSGWASIAGGFENVIENNVKFSAAFGYKNISGKNNSLLLTTPGAATFSAGAANINSGYGSIALGGNNRTTNLFSMASNHYTLSNAYAMSAFGHYNDTIAAYPGQNFNSGEMLFSIGNGIDNASRRNSFTMLRNGFTSINTSANTGPNIPRAELDVKGTGAIIVPVGTSAQRPVTPVVGMIRMCSDCGRGGTAVLQGYDGNNWVDL